MTPDLNPFSDYLTSVSGRTIESVNLKSRKPILDAAGETLYEVHTLTVKVNPYPDPREGPQPRRVFDWDRAAEIIREHRPKSVVVGRKGDTTGFIEPIYADGEVAPRGAVAPTLVSFLPLVLRLDWGEEVECWAYDFEHPEWTAETWWPSSALHILTGATSGTTSMGC
jgi:hypothetical protein